MAIPLRVFRGRGVRAPAAGPPLGGWFLGGLSGSVLGLFRFQLLWGFWLALGFVTPLLPSAFLPTLHREGD